MSKADASPLTDQDIEHFIQYGHVVVKDCFTREFAERWTSRAFIRLGYDPNDPSTWEREIVHMPRIEQAPMQEVSPKAWAAACALLGGEDRVKPCNWGDSLIVNFHKGADRPWDPPSAAVAGWHKDGDFFRHFLDSPEQGLLTIVFYSDVEPKGGGTFAARDSVAPVARLLARHPEGVPPSGAPEATFGSLINECHDFVELTGRIGDVVFIHPYVLHASSQNVSGKARFITNPPVNLKEPMQFNRPNPADLSPVERGVLRGLGVDSYDFKPTGERESIVSEGHKRKADMLDEHKARLAAAGMPVDYTGALHQ
jgi:hypothetical protein